jgi:hypothetical protein
VELRYAWVTAANAAPIGPKVSDSRVTALEVAASDGTWRSGRIPLEAGAGVVRVPLLREGRNVFVLEGFDEAGRLLELQPREVAIVRGPDLPQPILARSIGVVVRDRVSDDEVVEQLLPLGTKLPARGRYEFRTIIALEPGGDIEIISVYFVEGESPRPERNRLIGRLDITDRDVPRRIPAGSPLEIELNVAASRTVEARVYLPITDQYFDIELRLEEEQTSQADLTRRILAEERRLDSLAGHVTAEEAGGFRRSIEYAKEATRAIDTGDPSSVQRALMAVKEAEAILDAVESRSKLDLLRESALEDLDYADQMVRGLGNDIDAKRLDVLRRDLEGALASGNAELIRRAERNISRLTAEVVSRHQSWWEEVFDSLAAPGRQWSDPERARSLISQGMEARRRGDDEGLRRAVWGLWGLVPKDDVDFRNVGIRRS